MRLPLEVKEILDILNRAGHEAYAVGGCVRDALLGREPGDWDITTSAYPEEVKQLFRRTVDTGIRHGTVTVLLKGTGYEVTTYRVDGRYSDGRHPDQVVFTGSLREDLRRRDFTINAMACSSSGEILDLFGGRGDLKNGIIRCVGDPDLRFSEDALRLLRAVRFSAQLGFQIEPETERAISRHAEALRQVSRERIFSELNKILLSEHPEEMELLRRTDLAACIGEGFSEVRCDRRLALLPAERHLRWAAASEGMTPEDTDRMLRGLKSDNDTREKAALLVKRMKEPLPGDLYGARVLLSEIGEARAEDLFCLTGAGYGSGSPAFARSARELVRRVLEAGDCCSMNTLAVGGKDLMEAGIPAGPALGETLKALFAEVLKDPGKNERNTLLRLAAEQRKGTGHIDPPGDRSTG